MKVWNGALFVVALTAFSYGSVSGAALARGPYLQKGSPSNMVVRWRTDVTTPSRVRFGTDPGNLASRVDDSEETTEHKVKLTGLLPNTKHYYSIGAPGDVLASGPDYFFKTSPTNAKPTRIWVIGDSGTANANAAAVRDAYYSFAGTRYTDLWLMLGDNAYPNGTDEQYTAAVFDMYPDILRQTVLWPTIGNHETYADPVDLAYLSIFSLPTEGEAGGVPSGTERYYSFDYGNIHFVCLDAMNSDTTRTGPMATWLDQDLAANTNEWTIGFWHHPPYSKGSHDSDAEGDLIAMRVNFVPILESYGVDLVLCGHSHSYERSFLLHGHYGFSTELLDDSSLIVDDTGGRADETGPYVKGIAGHTNGTVYAVAGSSGQITDDGTLDHPAMFISLLRLGSLVLDIDGNRLEARFLQGNGTVGDNFTILKGESDDRFRITAFRLSGNLVTISWNSVAGKSYYVAFTPTLTPLQWSPVSGAIPAQGKKTSWTGFLQNNTRGFYQIVQL
jgi:hypothetical protein